MLRPLSLFLPLLSSGACSPVYEATTFNSPAGTPQVPFDALRVSQQGVIYERVRGRELRDLIVGSRMFNDPTAENVIVTGAGQLEFRSDGTFFQAVNGRIRSIHLGTYSVSHDWVCLKESARNECFALFGPAGGRYLTVYAKPNVAAPLVLFERLHPPC